MARGFMEIGVAQSTDFTMSTDLPISTQQATAPLQRAITKGGSPDSQFTTTPSCRVRNSRDLQIRKSSLLARNVRNNHIHVVVTAYKKPELVLNALKANATRQLRQEGLWRHTFSPWAFKGSKRRLWNEKSVQRAIDYVLLIGDRG
jgi:hypothetical protein